MKNFLLMIAGLSLAAASFYVLFTQGGSLEQATSMGVALLLLKDSF